MSILIDIQNKQQEYLLMAFLDSNAISYKTAQDIKDLESHEQFLEHYNQELDKADLEIESGDFLSQVEVELLLTMGENRAIRE